MSDFDIASTQNGTSFLESLKRRKAFGLDESDEEDSFILKKTKSKSKKHKKKSSKSSQDQSPNNAELTTASSSTTKIASPAKTPPPAEPEPTTHINPYLASDIELETIAYIPPPSTQTKPNKPQSAEGIIAVSDEDDEHFSDIEIEDLDPDLAALAHSAPVTSAQPEKLVIKLQYTHNFDVKVLSNSQRKSVQFLEKAVKIKAMDDMAFRILLQKFCESKCLKMDDVYLVYNDDIVFLSGTPASVGMRPVGTNKMEVYPKQCYANMLAEKEEKKQKERMRHLNATENEDDYDDDSILNAPESSASAAAAAAAAAAADDAAPEEERVRLSLRTSDNKVVPFRVKHTTTLRELVEAFKQRAQVSGNVQLSFEGETLDLDQAVQDTDLEDEDIVEVVSK